MEDEKSWEGSKFAACMWVYTKEALTGGQIFDREQEEYLKKRIITTMFCANWVGAGTFDDHEWCRQELSSTRKKFRAWHWISEWKSRVWYNGTNCGSLRPRTRTVSWEVT